MKKLQCPNCGAGIRPGEDKHSAVCAYCGGVSEIRVDTVSAATQLNNQINIVLSLTQEADLAAYPNKPDRFENHYARFSVHVSRDEATAADRVLDEILAIDPTQSRAWYYKSLITRPANKAQYREKLKYMGKAIANASTVRREYYVCAKQKLVDAWKRREARRHLSSLFWIGILVAVTGGVGFVIWKVLPLIM